MDSSKVTDDGTRSSHKIVFLGDYGDRGLYSIQIYYILLRLKTLFPDNVILMRGNHEAPYQLPFTPYDLPEQMFGLFGSEAQSLLHTLEGIFDYLYLGVIVSD
ncbi:MAG: metallophosphoesterase family protein, partial [Nitrososphaerales archaeon]